MILENILYMDGLDVFDNDKDFVIGNFEKIVYVTSEKSYNIFMETVTIDE